MTPPSLPVAPPEPKDEIKSEPAPVTKPEVKPEAKPEPKAEMPLPAEPKEPAPKAEPTPVVPSVPAAPAKPVVPEKAAAPEKPAVPEAPAIPEKPAVPESKIPPVPTKEAPKDGKATEDPFGMNDSGNLRQWTDASGEHSIEARFVSFQDGTVRLQKANGRYVRVEFDLLSSDDQQFVERQAEALAAR